MFVSRLSVVITCVIITIYKGYDCTSRYLSNPENIEMKYKGIETLPPLRYSICQKFTFADCSYPSYSFSFFNDFYNNDETECIFGAAEIPNYSEYNTSEEFWEFAQKDIRPGKYVKEISVRNKTNGNWETIFQKDGKESFSVFRTEFHIYQGCNPE